MNQYIDTLSKEYINRLNLESEQTILIIAKVHFEFWKEHIDFLKILYQNNLQFFLLRKYKENLPQIYEDLHMGTMNRMDNDELKYIHAFKMGGFWNILFEWLNGGAKEEPYEMATLVQNLELFQ